MSPESRWSDVPISSRLPAKTHSRSWPPPSRSTAQTPGRAIFIYVLIGMMVVLGAATAFALIFDIISVNVAERSGEIRPDADRRRAIGRDSPRRRPSPSTDERGPRTEDRA